MYLIVSQTPHKANHPECQSLLHKELVSDDKLEKKIVFPTVAKIEFVRPKQQEKPVRKQVKYAEMYRPKAVNTAMSNSAAVNAVRANQVNAGHPQKEDQGYVDSGCSRHMTGNMSYLSNFKEFDGGYVTFGGGAKGGKITGKGTLKTGKLDFEDVYFVKELQFNLFSVSQMCDKKNSLTDESQVLLKVPRKNNMYSVDMKNIVPKESLTCLVAKATLDESMLWHKRLGHVNFKTINKLVKENLVRCLPLKRFENEQTCVDCLKGKQHRAFYKSKIQNSITQPLFMLHMDLFGPTFVSNLMNKKYYLVVTDDYSRFTWNRVMNEFCEKKGIKKKFSVARTLQQNGVAERRNMTLIEAARTMLADSKLPTTFWAEAVNTSCYIENKVIIVKPHNKTPYELFIGRTPALSFMRPFGCHVTILNTLDHLGKFDGKSDDGFFVGYSLTSDGPKWLFDIDSLTKSMNYVPVIASTNSNDFAASEESNGAGHTSKETKVSQDYIVMPLWKDGSMFDSSSNNSSDDEPQPSSNPVKKDDEGVSKASGFSDQEQPKSSTPNINTVGPSINTASANFKTGSLNINTVSPTVITTRSNRSQNVSGMFSLGRSATLEATHVDLFGKTHEDLHTCLFACFLSQEEPKRTGKALCKRAIGIKWIFMNKKDERGIVTRNKARLVAQGYTQEEGIDYDKVFAHVARIEAIRLFLAYASFIGCMVYQMDVKSAFLYVKIEDEVYVCQPLGFEDPDYPDKVYKVVKALYGLHQAPRAWYRTLAKYLLDNGFQRGKIDKTLFIKKQKGDI
ncbi:retrovirus-related pol polyprotein from transposon TNT 1-94 [Tanacetum coccineum]